jgi:hypothetical protein
VEVAKIREELNEETQKYIDYHLNVHHYLRELHKLVASSFKEVKA